MGRVSGLEAGDAFIVDFEYGGPTPAPGLHLVAEASTGDFDPFAGEDFRGAQAWAGYRAPVAGGDLLIEPLLRVSHADIDRAVPGEADGGVLVTPGLNVYLGGLNRVMLNYDVWRAGAGRDAQGFRAQFQLAF